MKIEYYTADSGERVPVMDFIEQQPVEIGVALLDLIELFEDQGFGLIGTKYLKPMPGTFDLYELKIKVDGVQYRILLKKFGSTVYLLHAFIKKTGRTEKKHINTAENRADNQRLRLIGKK